ncbi:MAG: class I SAM-dependent methyltransferase [Desulfobacterales bacterium]|nr:class I SAM-dependent methyltransferase [Desulfobacterales bacterium]
MITVDFRRLVTRPGFKILDIGCGSGRHTAAAYELDRTLAVGADLNYSDVAKADERLRYHDSLGAHGGGRWALSTADICNLPFKTDAFDLVICSEVLEHIPADGTAMAEIIRVLKPEHDLVVSVPRFFPEKICWLLSDEYFNANQGHVRIYRQKSLVTRLERYGVTHRATHFAHSIHAPYWWLKCLVGPTREDSRWVNLYNRFLTWDIMQKPPLTRWLDRLLNPVLGKSLVLYFVKNSA